MSTCARAAVGMSGLLKDAVLQLKVGFALLIKNSCDYLGDACVRYIERWY